MPQDISIIAQPELNFADTLKNELTSGRWTSCEIAVAWTRQSGVQALQTAFESFLLDGGALTITTGVSFGHTTVEGLNELLSLATHGAVTAYVHHNEAGPVFHPKVYLFANPTEALVFIGSNNLTQSGLYTNTELCIGLRLPLSDTAIQDLRRQLASWRDTEFGLARQLSVDLIGQLQSERYIQSEMQVRQQNHAAQQPVRNNQLFAKRSVRAPVRRTGRRGDVIGGDYVPAPNDFWLVTGAMTGGSGNQLDFSRTVVHNRIPGGILALFGFTSGDMSTVTSITLRYQGLDYQGNNVSLPQAPNGKSNGTWRCYLNGANPDSGRLTQFCQEDNHHFRGKIMVFRKLAELHYEIVLVEDLATVESYKSRSRVWDSIRSSTRVIGIL